MGDSKLSKWDVFICHASEDKDHFVRPLATSLNRLGVDVWYDEFSLELGDSLSKTIDRGLANSKYGLVVISKAFTQKKWPDYELRGLISREIVGEKVILPIWHHITLEEMMAFSPPLADKLAFKSSEMSAEDMVIRILKVIRPDIYEKHPRAQLQKIASGDALRELQEELEYVKSKVDECPYCGAPLSGMADVKLSEHADGTARSYACGYSELNGSLQEPCPGDPNFPRLEDFELITQYRERYGEWVCIPKGRTAMARKLHLMSQPGKTEEESKDRVMRQYNQILEFHKRVSHS